MIDELTILTSGVLIVLSSIMYIVIFMALHGRDKRQPNAINIFLALLCIFIAGVLPFAVEMVRMDNIQVETIDITVKEIHLQPIGIFNQNVRLIEDTNGNFYNIGRSQDIYCPIPGENVTIRLEGDHDNKKIIEIRRKQ